MRITFLALLRFHYSFWTEIETQRFAVDGSNADTKPGYWYLDKIEHSEVIRGSFPSSCTSNNAKPTLCIWTLLILAISWTTWSHHFCVHVAMTRMWIRLMWSCTLYCRPTSCYKRKADLKRKRSWHKKRKRCWHIKRKKCCHETKNKIYAELLNKYSAFLRNKTHTWYI